MTKVGAEDLAAPAGGFLLSFEAFYARELRSVVGLAFVLSGSRSAAEDLAQDAFLAAYRHWDRIGSYDDPAAWVRRVVVNAAVSTLRRRSAEARALLRMGAPRIIIPEMPVDTLATWDAVRRLPKRQAQVIALRYYDGRTIDETARILDCTPNTVKTHLRRAKRALATALGEEAGDEDA